MAKKKVGKSGSQQRQAEGQAHRRTALSKDCLDGLFEALLIFSLDFPHLSDDKVFLNGGENGFYNGRFDKACRLPLLYRHFAKGRRLIYPAGYGHEDEIGTAV